MTARVCSVSGCPELAPCEIHPPRPWHQTSPRNRSRPSDAKERKLRVLARDGRRCYWCGRPGANRVDHVLAVADGGSWDESNLASMHQPCHREKTSRERAARYAQ